MLYKRSETDGEIVIQVTPAYYWLRYATLAVFAGYFIAQEAAPGTDWWKAIGPVVFLLLAANVIGMWNARREATRAMRDGSLQASGSAWNIKRPLRYAYKPAPAPARDISGSDR